MDRIKLLVVDDSILFREVLSRYIQQDDMIEIVGKAGDAYSARDMILQYEPDVMTLDLEMPRMDGAAFLKKLLPQYYISTIVVSSSDERKAACKEAGAVEFLAKPAARTNNDMAKFAGELCSAIRRAYKSNHPNANIDIPKISAAKPVQSDTKPTAAVSPSIQKNNNMAKMAKVAAMAEKTVSQTAQNISNSGIQSAVNKQPPPPVSVPTKRSKLNKSEAIIALGASTGGTEALEQVIRLFPADTPPVIIVQHMPAGFTKLYSERLCVAHFSVSYPHYTTFSSIGTASYFTRQAHGGTSVSGD